MSGLWWLRPRAYKRINDVYDDELRTSSTTSQIAFQFNSKRYLFMPSLFSFRFVSFRFRVEKEMRRQWTWNDKGVFVLNCESDRWNEERNFRQRRISSSPNGENQRTCFSPCHCRHVASASRTQKLTYGSCCCLGEMGENEYVPNDVFVCWAVLSSYYDYYVTSTCCARCKCTYYAEYVCYEQSEAPTHRHRESKRVW